MGSCCGIVEQQQGASGATCIVHASWASDDWQRRRYNERVEQRRFAGAATTAVVVIVLLGALLGVEHDHGTTAAAAPCGGNERDGVEQQ